ncbi:MAG: hypothetical protein COV67_07840 [Nitrospinae bacterium CG11_big_fil_rev_8_21_14_0_20_56_8]|nr:MAG: hypothetical protein COV67_07840 [Nitrospinae bacterium CG11_big_fil_rev_8_21_14_0_20_56_8]
MTSFLKQHPFLFFLVPYTFLLAFLGLGDSALQVDEAADTFVSRTILLSGLPSHTDGINVTMPFADVYNGLFVYRTWVPYYLQAGSLAIFGETTFGARFPSALTGCISVIALYFFGAQLTGRKWVGFLAAFFLASSVPALVYFRAARYMALPVLCTILLLHHYVKIFRPDRWRPIPFAAVAILYFHSMYVECAGTLAGLVLHILLHRKEIAPENLRGALRAGAGIALFTLPWIPVMWPVFKNISQYYIDASGMVDPSPWGYGKRLGAYLFQINNYIFPLLGFAALGLKALRPHKKTIHLLLLCLMTILVMATLHLIPFQQNITASYPLLFLLLALLVGEGLKKFPLGQALAVILLVTTNLLHVGPLYPIKALLGGAAAEAEESAYVQGAARTFVREVNLKSVYLRYWKEISHPYRGPLDAIVTVLQNNAQPGESCYIDNEPEAIAFYTGLKMIPADKLDPLAPPEWLILRGDAWYPEDRPPPTRVALAIEKMLKSHSYRKIVLDAPVRRNNNSYDIQLHLFQSPDFSDKIRMYRRIENGT